MTPIFFNQNKCICTFILNVIVALACAPNHCMASPTLDLAMEPLVYSSVSSPAGGAIYAADSSGRPQFLYVAGFDRSRWDGSLKKYSVNDSGGIIQLSSNPIWDAADVLAGQNGQTSNTALSNRKIYTLIRNGGKAQFTTEFSWDNLSSAQKEALNISPMNGVLDNLGAQRLDYVRGSRKLEEGQAGGIFRSRNKLLGDIVNCNPVYVGEPDPGIQGPAYKEFYTQTKARTKAIYVGANDGMLHGFDANDGTELFAYVPDVLISQLPQLSRPDYKHQPYVDGGIDVKEALVGNQWRTVLAVTFGAGAQGVAALDVTDPSKFGKGQGVLWEFTDQDDPEIGNVLNRPVIVKFKTGTSKGGATYRYFVMVASGVNSSKNDGAGKYTQTASSTLFLLALDKSPSDTWSLNNNYYKFSVPVTDSAQQSGLSSPAIAVGDDGAVRFAYAGDLQGNLWRFDFSASFPGRAGIRPLFIAKDSNSARQPITTQPQILFAPGGAYLVLFGTGKFWESRDVVPANFKQQSFYAIYDTTQQSYFVAGRNELEKRTVTSAGNNLIRIGGNRFVYGENNGAKKGWHIDFLDSEKTGERCISNPAVSLGRVFFNTLILCRDSCANASGRTYDLDGLTGLPQAEDTLIALSNFGLMQTPVVIESNLPLGITKSTGRPKSRKRYAVVNSESLVTVKGGPLRGNTGYAIDTAVASVPSKRLSWREITNWQDLRTSLFQK